MTDFPRRIVYVEDDSMIRDVVKTALERANQDIYFIGCETGHEFLKRLPELRPDLILMDLHMPEMNGPDVIEKLKEKNDYKDIPVIFVTGVSDIEMLEVYKNLGVIGIIHKPLSVEGLYDQIMALWSSYHAGQPEA